MINDGIKNSSHFRKLENMYVNAPIHRDPYYKGVDIEVSDSSARITLKIKPAYHHAANALHGCVYFKLLDDAAVFAACSVTTDVMMVTGSFNIHLLRPVADGIITAEGSILYRTRNLIVAKAALYNDRGKVIAEGSGNFMKSKTALSKEIGYELPSENL